MALTTNQLVVGMFNMAAGGFTTLVSDYVTAHGNVAAADALLASSGLNPQFMGTNLYDNNAFAAAVVGRVLSSASTTVQSSVATIVSNYMTANPTLSRGAVVVAVLEAVLTIPSTDATLGAAASAYTAKVTLADASTSTSTDMTVLAGIVGATPAATAGQTFTLTTGVDNIVGTSAAETFSGLQTGGTDETFSTYDAIDGGAGTDTLNITNTEAAALNMPTVANIENIVYRSVGGGGDIDMANFAGATSLTMDRTVGAADVASLALTTALTFDTSGATTDTTVTYLATGVTGTADAGAVTVDGVADGAELDFAGDIESFTVTASGAASRFDNFVLPGTVTALTIDAAVGFRVDDTFTAAALETLTITGAGAVTITPALAGTVETVAASAATGAVTLTMGAADQTITTGSAADVIDMDANLDKDDVIDLGEGEDTLRIDVDGLAAGVTDLQISNVETFRFDNTAGNNGAINMDSLTPTAIRIDGVNDAAQAATAGVITLTDLATTIASFDLIGQGTDGAASDNVAFNGLTVDYDVSGTTNVASVTFNINNAGTVGDDFFVQKLSVENVEAVEVVAADIGSAAADELTITEIEGNDMETVTITSNGEVIVNDIDGDVLEAVNLSGVAAGGAAVTISDHAAALTVTGSAGNDTITMTDNTNTSAVTVDLGEGNDAFVSVDATDTITTGDGSDTLSFQGDANDDANIITDFTAGNGGDIIDFVTNSTSGQGTAVLTAYTEYATAAAWATGTAAATGDENDDGVVVIGANLAGTAAADIETLLGNSLVFADTATTGAAGATTDAVYLVADDGTDTYIYLLVNGGAVLGQFDAADDTATLLVTLQGVTDATALTSANFADFLG
jgi:hypothetical protein